MISKACTFVKRNLTFIRYLLHVENLLTLTAHTTGEADERRDCPCRDLKGCDSESFWKI